MKIQSFQSDILFNEEKIQTKVILETAFSKEIRIILKEGHLMKEHKAPFPIIVHVLNGAINFGVQGEIFLLNKGDIITLESNVPHDLTALQDSVVRLTLSKQDDILRVENVAKK